MPSTTDKNKSIAPTSIGVGTVALGTNALGSTNTDTPSNAVKVMDAGSEGARISSVTLQPRDTVVATRVFLFRGNDAAGTTKRLIRSVVVAAGTFSTTAATPASVDFGFNDSAPLFLGPGESLWAGQTVAQATSALIVNAEGGRYNTP